MKDESSLILFASTFCFPGALCTSEHRKRMSLICILYYYSSKPSGLDFKKWPRLLSAPESQSTWHFSTSENHLLKTKLYVKSLIWCLLEAMGAFLLFHSTLDNVLQEIEGIAGNCSCNGHAHPVRKAVPGKNYCSRLQTQYNWLGNNFQHILYIKICGFVCHLWMWQYFPCDQILCCVSTMLAMISCDQF